LDFGPGFHGGIFNETRLSRTTDLVRRNREATSRSGCFPKSRISRAVQGLGPVGKRMRLRNRSATTSLIVHPNRLARTESGTRPSL